MYSDELADTIAAGLSREFRVHEDVLQFAESVLDMDEEELHRELETSGKDGDPHGLLELILFPSQKIRREIEPTIPHEGLKRSFLEDLEKVLAGTKTFLLLAGYSPVPLIIDNNRAAQYLNRLHIDRPVPSFSVRSDVEKELVIEARIAIRNARFHPLPERMAFLGKLLEKGEAENLLSILSTILKTFEESPPGIRVREELGHALERYRRARDGALRWEEFRKTYSPEFMMMQKINHPGMEAIEAEERIRGILMAGRTVYGPAFGVPIPEEEAKSADDVIRFFRNLDS